MKTRISIFRAILPIQINAKSLGNLLIVVSSIEVQETKILIFARKLDALALPLPLDLLRFTLYMMYSIKSMRLTFLSRFVSCDYADASFVSFFALSQVAYWLLLVL
jgi:hypothetical protein